MGFLRKRKNNDIPLPKEIDIETKDISSEVAAEDDFSPIRETQKVTREDFKKAAAENLIESINEQETSESSSDDETDADEQVSEETAESEEISVSPEYTDEDDFIPDDTAYADEDADDDSIEADEAVPPKKPRKPFKEIFAEHKKGFITAISAVSVLFVAALAIYIYGCCTIPTDRMGRNIYIENINVSNLTYEEALEKVKTTTLLDNQEITLTGNGQTFKINGAEVGLTPNIEETVDKAMRYGKTNNVFIDGFANALQIFAKHTVAPDANVNEGFVKEKLYQFGVQIHGELIEHKLELGDGIVICTPGHTGFNGNTDIAYNEILSAIENGQFHNIKVTLQSGPPRDLTAQDVDVFTYCNPIIAWFQYVDNNINIIPEVPGRYLNMEETADLVTQVKEGGEVVYIPYYYSIADITAEMLQAKLFNAELGSYTTNYGGSTSNRCANIKNAASKIDGKILAPGEVFSFNDTVGKRSIANGFFTATEYANGAAVQGIGGGTCQVSSTLYNAVLYSDLSIVSRTEHMFAVGYCPLGQDATVADSGVDFKFVNDMDYPIKISATTTGYSITVRIIGTQRDDPRTVKIINTSTKVNADTKVRSVRQVYNSAGELIREEALDSSYYRAH